MPVLIRAIIPALLLLTVVYVCLLIYYRAVKREKLEAIWDAEQGPGDRSSYVSEELAKYQDVLRSRLIIAVYVIPFLLVATIIYLTNYA